MMLIQAVAILSARFHCGAEWTIAYNGIGPHAYGITPGHQPNIHLNAEDAIRLAAEYEDRRCSP